MNVSERQQPTNLPQEARRGRLNVRATKNQEHLIRRAAEASDTTVTEFVLRTVTLEAERVLADRRWFIVNDAQWTEFNRMLDAPLDLDTTAKLRWLMDRPSPFATEDA